MWNFWENILLFFSFISLFMSVGSDFLESTSVTLMRSQVMINRSKFSIKRKLYSSEWYLNVNDDIFEIFRKNGLFLWANKHSYFLKQNISKIFRKLFHNFNHCYNWIFSLYSNLRDWQYLFEYDEDYKYMCFSFEKPLNNWWICVATIFSIKFRGKMKVMK